MGIVVGIDIGGSTTKIAGFDGSRMLVPVQISANSAVASLFGKASSRASSEDKAAGIVHMVIETICQTAVLIANGNNIKDFVLIGNLINFPECWRVCDMIKLMYPDVNFIIPEDGEYGTAIGTALADKCCLKPV